MEQPATDIPDVTISIVNHCNREEVLECLRSLQETAARALEVEIVVLDNASDDGSVEAIRAAFPEVRVIAQPYRAGFGENHNRVIRSSSSRYVFVLNDDTRVDGAAIAAMVRYLDEHPNVAVVGPKIVGPGEVEPPSAWRFPSPAACALFALTFGTAGIVQSHGSEPRPADWVSGSAMMLRRSALDVIGLFDDQIYMYMEETDLCRRLWDAGYEIHYLPTVSIFHEGWGSTGPIPDRRTNELWRSRRYYWAKHHSVVGTQLARALDALRYGVGAVAVRAALAMRLTSGRLRIRPDDVRMYRLNALNAVRGVRGPGIREMATAFNAAKLAVPVRSDREEPLAAAQEAQAGPWETRRPWAGLAKAAVTSAQVSLAALNGQGTADTPGLRILCYHRIASDRDQLALSQERFREQLELLAESDFEVVDLSSYDFEAPPTGRQLAITFDDGYRDFAERALPELERVAFPAVVFVVPEAVERRLDFPWYRNATHPPLLHWDEIVDIERRTRIRFEPHGMTHPRLPRVPPERARWEIVESKRVVESALGREAHLFCYPGGYYGRREMEFVAEAGYAAAVTCEYGLNVAPLRRYELRRTLVDRYDTRWLFEGRLGARADRAPVGRRARVS
jgi:GT2 family glycosyltransferase/peptidoglycan/xylan/chitin deacetylase (PgdA/CDA1 family)